MSGVCAKLRKENQFLRDCDAKGWVVRRYPDMTQRPPLAKSTQCVQVQISPDLFLQTDLQRALDADDPVAFVEKEIQEARALK